MSDILNLKNASFLVYGLGSTGNSVIRYFKKKKIDNFFVWDDELKLRKKFGTKYNANLFFILKKVDYIVLSPGISLKNTKNKEELLKFKRKIITDIDLLYLDNTKFKSIVVTGSNGKSTTCKIISHLLKKNKFEVVVGGNIGVPVLDLKIKKNTFLVIEASSFQLSHSKFISPNYAILLNITNDHLDWHGSMKAYVQSKLKIFQLQKRDDYALVNIILKKNLAKKNYLGKFTFVKSKEYEKIKSKIKNDYLRSKTNDDNMHFVFALANLLKIKKKSFIKSMNSFKGLPHRYEIFLKKKNTIFINDSKATSFQATKFALASAKNIYWILGGLPKDKDKINLHYVKKNIIKSYIIGKNINHFKKQIKNKIKFSITRNLKKTLAYILKDIKLFNNKDNIILLSPGAASFDQFKNFEERGNYFKRLSRQYAKKII
tara:strand:+ start:221 stop:1513 length:1293 start_codon:yes stop_codon:yes gene_type:complete